MEYFKTNKDKQEERRKACSCEEHNFILIKEGFYNTYKCTKCGYVKKERIVKGINKIS